MRTRTLAILAASPFPDLARIRKRCVQQVNIY